MTVPKYLSPSKSLATLLRTKLRGSLLFTSAFTSLSAPVFFDFLAAGCFVSSSAFVFADFKGKLGILTAVFSDVLAFSSFAFFRCTTSFPFFFLPFFCFDFFSPCTSNIPSISRIDIVTRVRVCFNLTTDNRQQKVNTTHQVVPLD